MHGRGIVEAGIALALWGCASTSDRIESGPAAEHSVTAMVAARDLQPGIPITESDLYARLVPTNYLARGVYLDPSEVVGKLPRYRILAHEPLRADAMIHPGAPITAADRIPSHSRAVEVPTWGATPTVGHTVDVWWSPAGRPCTVMQAVEVHEVSGDRAKLLVSPQGALELVAVARQPTFRLTIRAADDRGIRPETACTR